MIARFAYVGLTLTALAAPAWALEVPPAIRAAAAGAPPDAAAATASGERKAPRSARHQRRRARYATRGELQESPAQAAPAAASSAQPSAPAAAAVPSAQAPVAEVAEEPRRRRGRRYRLARLADTDVAPSGERAALDAMIASHAKANNIPPEMVHRIVVRESKYNPRAVGRGGAMGLMQIKHSTARALGYSGSASGLLDADTNLRYAVRYLAGAYRTAHGDPNRTVSYYARGYYYAAKRQGLPTTAPDVDAQAERLARNQQAAQQRPSIFRVLFDPKGAAENLQAAQNAGSAR